MGKKNKNVNYSSNFEVEEADIDQIMENDLNSFRNKNKNKKRKDKVPELINEDDNDSELHLESHSRINKENVIVSKKEDINEEVEEEESVHEEKILENNIPLMREIKQKIKEKLLNKISGQNVFLERLTVDCSPLPKLNIDDDIKRELYFYNLAFEGAVNGINKLKENKQKLNRPDDFMAEMLKSDEQMMKIKKEILSNNQRIKKFQLREEKMLNKKFNKKTKGVELKKTQDYKKTSKEAIDHWKRSIKENPDEYYKLDNYVNKPVRNQKSMSRKNRNVKFNPKMAHEAKIKEINRGKPRKSGFNRSERAPKGKFKRPGKEKRQNNRNKKFSKH